MSASHAQGDGRRRRRVVAAAAAIAVLAPFAALVVGMSGAEAAGPAGSAYPLFLEQGPRTGDPAAAITGGGFWGHEGPARDAATTISADTRDGSTALLDAFGAGSTDDLAVAFTTTSPDGSNEAPAITAGENLGQAYRWFTQRGFGASLAGSSDPAADEVLKVSTISEYQAWIDDGRPEQHASSDDLVLHDTARAGSPVSVAPQGRSVLDRWAAGQDISLVVVRTTGATDPATGLPIVAADSTGHATAAWIPLTTAVDHAVGDAAHPDVATSGAYTLAPDPGGSGSQPVAPADAGATPTTTAVAVNPGTEVAYEDVVLTATVSPVVPGTVQFKDGIDAVGSPATVDGSGVATLTTRQLGAGDHSITAVFTPADPTAYAGSSATAPTFTLNAAGGSDASDGNVAAEIPPGQLLVSTPYGPGNPLDLGRLLLNPNASKYTGEVAVEEITVSDTRAGALPWTLDALASDLTAPGGKVIDAQNVGLVGFAAVSASGSGTVTPYAVPPADPPVQPGAAGTLGLGRTPKPILASTAGPGSVTYRATLRVNAPTSSRAGHYTGTLTLTIS